MQGKNILPIILVVKAWKSLKRDCFRYLVYVVDTGKEGSKLDDIPVAQEFLDVFPEKLPGVPSEREIKYEINLIPGVEPISKTPYRMEPAEIKALKEQFYEVLDMKFISPNVSPWGASVLFVKKKYGSM